MLALGEHEIKERLGDMLVTIWRLDKTLIAANERIKVLENKSVEAGRET